MKAIRSVFLMKIRIGTHNGTFHCDEGLACFLLRQLPEYKEGFQKVLALVGAEFKECLHYYMRSLRSCSKRFRADISGELLLLSLGCCPWKEHLFVLEKQLKLDVLIKFVLYPDQSGHWRVQCVPAGLNTFQNRLSLLEEWRGLQNEALSERSGIPGCIFVHASGFIGDNWTLEMAKRMLQTAPRAVLSTRHTLKTPSASFHWIVRCSQSSDQTLEMESAEGQGMAGQSQMSTSSVYQCIS
ncbi:UPF0160 protein MYG1, mitochondrial-like [Sinocyclocheilus grahami]|uniref:UPF0160 protein MYG1, mitochondrial-like n=1 Tax=Sinocyclocheilus grahami TaxID=75366 RepID=UPI0007AC5DF6|nr:PREDICTED: UPF0160 protein MYG1, mitochondrial-like [Sinocyclocheilus grahami]